MSLSISSKFENNVSIISIEGEITFENSTQLREQIDKECEQGHYNIIIDLIVLKYMSSAGMGVLVHGIKQTRANNGDLRLINLSEKMHRVFLITQFTHHFKVYNTLEEAVKSFAS